MTLIFSKAQQSPIVKSPIDKLTQNSFCNCKVTSEINSMTSKTTQGVCFGVQILCY